MPDSSATTCLEESENRTPEPVLDRPSRLGLAIAVGLAVAALAVLILIGKDISAAPWIADDGMLRHAATTPARGPARLADPSGHVYHLPDSLLVQRSLRALQLPLWNRYQGGGFSSYVQLQGALLSPLRWPFVVVPESHLESARLLLFVALALAGTLALLRRLGASTSGSVLGGAIYALSPACLGLAFPCGMAPHALLPWVALTIHAFMAQPTGSRFGFLTLAVMLTMTSGHPVLIASAMIIAVVIGVSSRLCECRSRLPWGGTAAALLLGLAVSAWALMPFGIALADHSVYKFDSPMPPARVSLADWSGAMRAVLLGPEVADAPAESLHAVVHLGPLTLALGLVGLAVAFRARRWRFLLVTLVVAAVACLPGPWLAGLPQGAFWSPGSAPMYGAMLAIHGALAAAAGWDWLARHVAASRRRLLVAATIVACVAPGLIQAGSLFWPATSPLPASSPATEYLEQDADLFRIASLDRVHAPNLGWITGIEDLSLMTVLVPPRTSLWFDAVDPDLPVSVRGTLRRTPRVTSPLLGQFNVKYIARARVRETARGLGLRPSPPAGIGMAPELGTEGQFPLVYRDAFVEVFRNDVSFMPRVGLAQTLRIVDSPAAARDALRGHSARAGVDVVEAPDAFTAGLLGQVSPAARGNARVSYPSNSRAVLDVDIEEGPALVILRDALADGWSARVDGASVPILAVNLLSRGVVVEPGRHRVEMRYIPPGLPQGVAISALAALLALMIGRHLGRPDSGASPHGAASLAAARVAAE